MGSKQDVDGFVYRVAWSSPYSDPPGGKRILAEMFVLRGGAGGAPGCPDIAAFQRPPGYVVTVSHVGPPTRSKTPEQRAALRQKRVAARNAAKAPLFAEQFTAEDIAQKEDYYLRGTSSEDEAYQEAIERERAIYERLLTEHGRLIVY
jgi:hypothetical protein